jgi:hypothetical protein
MSNETNTPDSTPAFDLFGLPDEDNLKEQLAKGSFQWTNKYTRILAIVLVLMGCLSAGAVYGHYSATKSTSAGGLTAGNLSSLRAAFGGGSGASGFGAAGAVGAGGFSAGGFGGGGFSRGTAGTVTKVSGNTVTITLTATPTTPIKAGDNVTVRGATAGAAAGGFGGAAGGLTGGTGAAASGSSAGTSAGAPGTSAGAPGTSAGAPGGAGTASGAPRSAGAGGTGGAGGGRFSNPAFTACLAKAGVTFTAGTRPDFTDPKVAAAIQSCATSLGLSVPGAGGFGGGAGRSAAPAPVTSGSPTP